MGFCENQGDLWQKNRHIAIMPQLIMNRQAKNLQPPNKLAQGF
jgi:hypothetical protein